MKTGAREVWLGKVVFEQKPKANGKDVACAGLGRIRAVLGERGETVVVIFDGQAGRGRWDAGQKAEKR